MIQASSDYISAITSTQRMIKARLLVNGQELTGDIVKISVTKGACADAPIPGSLWIPYISAVVKNCTASLGNEKIEYQIGAAVSGSIEWITVGTFTVIEPVLNNNLLSFSGIGTLGSELAEGIYESELTYPASLQSVINEIETKSGYSVTIQGLTVAGNLETKFEGLLYRDALAYIAGLLGGFLTEDALGNPCIAKYASGETRIITPDQYQAYPDSNEMTYRVTGLKVIVTPGGVNESGQIVPEVAFTSGTPNITVINPYMTESLFTACAANIVGLSFKPGSIRMHMGDPRLEPWDLVNPSNPFPAFQIVHTYTGGLTTEISARTKTDLEGEATRIGPITQQVQQLNADLFTAKQAIIGRATIQQLQAIQAQIDELDVSELAAVKAYVETLIAGSVTAADIQATVGAVDNLSTTYAQIDFANIENESVKNLFVNVGLIENATIQEGKITGTLSGVRVVADIVQANTVIAGDLLVRDSTDPDTYYKINVQESGTTEEVLRSLEYNQYISGTEILAKSIVAEKISVSDLVAFGATIGGFTIDNTSIHSTGKSGVNTPSEGVYFKSGPTAQFEIGSSVGNHVTYDGTDVDIQTDWLKFDGTNDMVTVGESNSRRIDMSSSNFKMYDSLGANIFDIGEKSATNIGFNEQGIFDDFSSDPTYSLAYTPVAGATINAWIGRFESADYIWVDTLRATFTYGTAGSQSESFIETVDGVALTVTVSYDGELTFTITVDQPLLTAGYWFFYPAAEILYPQFSMGLGLQLGGIEPQVVVGKYNIQDSIASVVVGGGSGENDRKNLMAVYEPSASTDMTMRVYGNAMISQLTDNSLLSAATLNAWARIANFEYETGDETTGLLDEILAFLIPQVVQAKLASGTSVSATGVTQITAISEDISRGSKITFDTSSKRFIIGAGVSVVKVSFMGTATPSTSTTQRWLRINARKNGANTGPYNQQYMTNGATAAFVYSALLSVAEGDYIDFTTQTGTANTVTMNAGFAFSVEAIA